MAYKQPAHIDGPRLSAPLDEKNVTTDWIEGMFDSFQAAEVGFHTYVGTIRNCLVTARYDENRLRWLVYPEDGDPKEAHFILYHRLKDAETPEQNIYSDIICTSYRDYSTPYQIIQKFYFKPE